MVGSVSPAGLRPWAGGDRGSRIIRVDSILGAAAGPTSALSPHAHTPARHRPDARRPRLPRVAGLRQEDAGHRRVERRRQRAGPGGQRRRRAAEGSARRASPDHRAVRRREEADRRAARRGRRRRPGDLPRQPRTRGQGRGPVRRQRVGRRGSDARAGPGAGLHRERPVAVRRRPPRLPRPAREPAGRRRAQPDARRDPAAQAHRRRHRGARRDPEELRRGDPCDLLALRAARHRAEAREVGRLRQAPGHALHARCDPEGAWLRAADRRGRQRAGVGSGRDGRGRLEAAEGRQAGDGPGDLRHRPAAQGRRPHVRRRPAPDLHRRDHRHPQAVRRAGHVLRGRQQPGQGRRPTAPRTWARTPRSAASCWPRATSSATTA